MQKSSILSQEMSSCDAPKNRLVALLATTNTRFPKKRLKLSTARLPDPRASAPHDAILVQGVVLVKPSPGGFQLDGLARVCAKSSDSSFNYGKNIKVNRKSLKSLEPRHTWTSWDPPLPPSPPPPGPEHVPPGQARSPPEKGRKPRLYSPRYGHTMVEITGKLWELMAFRICFNHWICREMWKLPIIRETLNCFSNNHWICRENSWNSPIVRET